MEDTPTVAAVRRFLALVLEGIPPADAVLARALDELALAYHDAPIGEPDDNDDGVDRAKDDYRRLYDHLGARFPEYGYYPVVDPAGATDQENGLNDAIDDLADITRDLGDTLWRFEHFNADDAHWHFRFDYQIHWGRHLRELSYYLYAKISRDLSER
ncbi:MAG: DUF5063 domain-containing protein [Sphingomonas sp.]|nr:DUF5063 domain-containing protein [Sphingomonas sp.]